MRIWHLVWQFTWTILLLMPREPTPHLPIAIKVHSQKSHAQPHCIMYPDVWCQTVGHLFSSSNLSQSVAVFGCLVLDSGAALQIYADSNVFISMHNYLTAGSCDIQKVACTILWSDTSAFIEIFHINIHKLVFAYVWSSAPVCIQGIPKN